MHNSSAYKNYSADAKQKLETICEHTTNTTDTPWTPHGHAHTLEQSINDRLIGLKLLKINHADIACI